MASRQRVVLTIPNGAADTPELELRNCRSFSIQAPAVLTNAVVLQSSDSTDAAGTFATVQSPPGTDVSVAAAKTTVITAAPFNRIRMHAAGNEAAARDFVLWLEIGE